MSALSTAVRRLQPKRIRYQLILGIAVVHLVLMSIFIFDLVQRQAQFLKRQNKDQAFSLANNFAVNASSYVQATEIIGLNKLVETYRRFPHLRYAMVLDEDGVVLAHTDSRNVGQVATDKFSAGLQWNGLPQVIYEDGHILDIAAPIHFNDDQIGWIRLGLGQEHILQNLQGIWRNGILYTLAALIIGTVFAILIGNQLSRALSRMVETAGKIKQGDRRLRVPPFRSYEMSNLGTAINQMLDEIALSESTVRNAFEYSGIGMAIVGLDGKWTRVNQALCDIVGYPATELLELTFQDITHPDDLNADLTLFHKTMEGEIKNYTMEKRYIRKGGALVWINLNVSLVRDSAGQPLFFISQIEDINERKEMTEQLRESEQKFRSLVEQSLVGVLILQDDKLVYVNPGIEKVSGYSKQVLLANVSFWDIIHKEDIEHVRHIHHARMNGLDSDSHYTFRAVHKNGNTIYVEAIISPTIFEGNPAVIATLVDITEQVREQRRLDKAVIEAQEQERLEIGMELHDNVKQIMAAALLSLHLVKLSLPEDEGAELIDPVSGYIKEGIHELRKLSHQLAPAIDNLSPLSEKIQAMVKTMAVADSMQIHLDFDIDDLEIDPDIQLGLYRIAQEQLSNVIKYAEASVVNISLQQLNGDLVLTVKDNGIGFDTSARKTGIGLENIKRRIHALNGKMQIVAAPGKGCELTAQAPL